jgi:hypothetical protein
MAGASATKGGGHRASVRQHGNEPYRVYYGDGGEQIDSRLVKGLVNRQVRE